MLPPESTKVDCQKNTNMLFLASSLVYGIDSLVDAQRGQQDVHDASLRRNLLVKVKVGAESLKDKADLIGILQKQRQQPKAKAATGGRAPTPRQHLLHCPVSRLHQTHAEFTLLCHSFAATFIGALQIYAPVKGFQRFD